MFKNNILYFIGLLILGIVSAYIIIVQPHGAPFPLLQNTFFLFGLGLNTTILLWSIGLYLLTRWRKTGKENDSLFIWGFSFLIYSITFIAHIFRALGIEQANENFSVIHFFFYRYGMIIWASGIILGLLKIFFEKPIHYIAPSLAILIIGTIFFILGLFILPFDSPIESTMYLFLFIIWIPICFTMAYIFYLYGSKFEKKGPKITSLGFIGLMITYMAWAPFHFADVVYLYFVWYFLFMLSLIPILIGFIVLSLESE
ncbi:MAG: hypothetical protein ACP6IY_11345 [Promethearchaeia archaeon]